MKESITKRLYTIKERLYIEAKYLSEYGFSIGQPIKYEIDNDKNIITIIPVNSESKKHVAKTTQKTGKTVPVIDIKAGDVKAFFSENKQVEVEIHQGKIIFSVLEQAKTLENVISFEEAKNQKLHMENKRYSISISEFGKVVNYEQMDMFDWFRSTKDEIKGSLSGGVSSSLKEKAIKMLSLFSGCGSMDKGFLDEKYDIVFANDRYEKKALKDYHIQTYRNNIGDHIIMQDVMNFKESDIPEVDFVAAGIPCVTFSNLNTINNFRNEESIFHPIVEQTLNIIQWSKAKAFLFENVGNFLTVKGGIMLKRLKERLSNFNIATSFIDSSLLGSAQKRRRAFVFGTVGENPTLEIPHLSEVRTVKDAFIGIEGVAQQEMHFVPTEKTLERMVHVPQGGNILNVPEHLRAPNKKFSNYCMRLAWDKQSPTITHVQDEVFIHPDYNRYLTVRETARLFSLPDDFMFTGSLTAIFEMLKNAVDYRVSRFLAKTIKKQIMPTL